MDIITYVFALTLLYPGFLDPRGGGAFTHAGHISRMDVAINMKFGTQVVLHKRSKKIKLKWRLLPWLPDDVIIKCQNRQNLCIT